MQKIIHELPAPGWVVDEDVFSYPELPDTAHRDSGFALQNGFFGCKGTRPGTEAGRQGTYLWGLFDATGPYAGECGDSSHEWIVPVAPNLWHTRIADGKVDVKRIKRSLDLRNGILVATGEISIGAERWRVDSIRFLSWANRKVAVECLSFQSLTPESAPLNIELRLDDSVQNRRGKVYFDAWHERRWKHDRNRLVWQAVTRGSAKALAIAMAVEGPGLHPLSDAPGMCATVRQAATFVRFVGVDSVETSSDPAASAAKACASAVAFGFQQMLEDHKSVIGEFWKRADIEIDGPVYDQQITRFAVFRIGECMPDSPRYSYGAKLLAGQHYNGMVFWDVDMFILPYLTRVFPEKARMHLDFRYAGLEGARAKAREFGYPGAMYPWNAGPAGGYEASCTVFGDKQLHITADVAWGVVDYVTWTGDIGFMNEKGREMLAECARFWAARVERDGGIRDVIGPDEHAKGINNNAYTNHMVQWSLRQASEWCRGYAPEKEIAQWLEVAERIIQQQPDAEGLVEQYDGYFELPRGDIEQEFKGHTNRRTQTLKQADYLMLPFVFPENYPSELLKINFEYYEARNSHGSSLSLAPHCVAASMAGMPEKAYDYYIRAGSTDLRSRWESDDGGLHAAACGALPLALWLAFAGMRRVGDDVTFAPALPEKWNSLQFNLWRNGSMRLYRFNN